MNDVRRGTFGAAAGLLAGAMPAVVLSLGACGTGGGSAEPPPDARRISSRPDEAAPGLCGAPGEPCCPSPLPTCNTALVCREATATCEPEAVNATVFCQGDADCPASEHCCPAGLQRSCQPVDRGACPLPDLMLLDEVDPFLYITLSGSAPGACSPEKDCQCLYDRGCSMKPGLRYVLVAEPFVTNVGDADLLLGNPEDSARFEHDACDGTPYLDSYMRYELIDSNGVVAASQDARLAWRCNPAYINSNVDVRFSCEQGGLQHGLFSGSDTASFFDTVYLETFGFNDCPWIDVTDVAPGAYQLQVTVNPERTIDERSFVNNSVRYPVQMPAFGDPLRACEPDSLLTIADECGWNPAATPVAHCTPGTLVRLGCPDCFGSPQLRICEGAAACTELQAVRYTYPPVTDYPVIGPTCPEISFSCPASGEYSMFSRSGNYSQSASSISFDSYSCDLRSVGESAAEAAGSAPSP